jgi:hypothetical protein
MNMMNPSDSAACIAVPRLGDSLSASPEPFERRHLRVLSEEGIDLRAFLRGWRASMNDDLMKLRRCCEQRDVAGLRASLHRLSGAVAMVGARSLMEALQDASVTVSASESDTVQVLVERANALMRQLDEAIES